MKGGSGSFDGRRVVVGQHVTEAKAIRAREMRQAMTPAEGLLWRALRGNQFHGLHFRRQQIIDGFIVDFYCHQARLIVEVDGAVHTENQIYDEQREAVLRERGLRVLRLTNDEVLSNLQGVMARIGDVIAEHREARESPDA